MPWGSKEPEDSLDKMVGFVCRGGHALAFKKMLEKALHTWGRANGRWGGQKIAIGHVDIDVIIDFEPWCATGI